MNFKGVEIFCPHCGGDLDCPRGDTLICRACRRTYPVILDIPDLRIFSDPYIGLEEDRAKGRRLAERFHEFDFEGFVDFYYRQTAVVPAQHAQQYKRGLMAAEHRARTWLQAWEGAAAGNGRAETLLEIGCGTGPLLVAAKRYPQRVGVDIAFRWLVVGKKRLAEAGLDLPLICACAEALPFAPATFDRVVADSVIEHVQDQPRALTEVHRVLRAGGLLFVATPNRFSLGPDPQTGVWGGSWLPGSCTDAIVRRQGGIPPVRHLLSAFALRRLLDRAHFEDIQVFLPPVPPGRRAQFSQPLQQLMATYDFARRVPLIRELLYLFGPMLQSVAVCRRQEYGSAPE